MESPWTPPDYLHAISESESVTPRSGHLELICQSAASQYAQHNRCYFANRRLQFSVLESEQTSAMIGEG